MMRSRRKQGSRISGEPRRWPTGSTKTKAKAVSGALSLCGIQYWRSGLWTKSEFSSTLECDGVHLCLAHGETRKFSLLTFKVLYCHIQRSGSNPPPHPDATWRRSRYIIDNRRNALFSKKPLTAILHPQEPTTLSQETSFPAERYHKDLTAEASISEPKFYRKLGENFLPGKVIKSYKMTGGLGDHPNHFGVFGNQKNTSGVLDPQNFIHNEDVLNDVGSKIAASTEKLPSWELQMSSTVTTSKKKPKTQTVQEFEFDSPTTSSYPWELNSKTEESNQIDGANEKHVYETRIETVSYHQEVIFNPPKKPDWYREEEKQEQNYELPEENYEESEKNYELDEMVNVMPEDRIHSSETEENQNKFGYVVEGTNYRKYRVEERTADGFIVGEYGVVSHDDGSLRGVRYTADGSTNPKLIYETLIKFLSL